MNYQEWLAEHMKDCDSMSYRPDSKVVWEAATKAAREACAKVCDEIAESIKRNLASCEHGELSDEGAASVASDCATAIRAL